MKFFIQTFGCQMNVYDGQRIASLLESSGWTQTAEIPDADLIILNTCAVREKASEKIFSMLGKIAKEKKPAARMGIVGCAARAEGEKAFRRIKGLNFVLGPQSYHKIPEVLEQSKYMDIDLSGLEKFDALPENTRSTAIAYIPVQEGCSHCCTYCVVPFTRGPEVSRDMDSVLREVKSAAERGAREICFLGQNVNGYKPSLADLIIEAAKIPSIKRIRYTSSYPTEMSDNLIQLHGTEEKLLPFVNMPLQSGSPRILRKMNRPDDLGQYIEIVEKFKRARPDIKISSDFIVGFPGETEEDFQMTMDMARKMGFINSYPFKYSPRPRTLAAAMPDQVPEGTKARRLKELDNLLGENNREFNLSLVGRTLPCIIDEAGKIPNQAIARTPWTGQVVLDGGARFMGKLVDIKITGGNKSSLRGEIK
ncbi:MAG: tRNA (N6-isopentenyl adenosine(37)-C2)-methylthiotransferase MiaB [Rickettsiales bacterium]|jgi:tRNA-2-methylthio-N6-dimethylallyladenosine synthase|nr:tRNA (N6-isopentenyl adenosine(37)-C2)-methylthiotransferase MiaB [Rickettsiales bacterium]